ncbi:MAG: bacillithiol biosynthesis cysteine-adding enzyme BshC [Flavobacteriales bacterium]
MKKHKISYSDTQSFSKIVQMYTEEKVSDKFYNRYPNINQFKDQIKEKQSSNIDRGLLYEVLKNQNSKLQLSKKTEQNIELLKSKNSFTITTGHQLCLFTGPLYFIYKIVSAINLSKQLTQSFPENNFIPVFWMASEDHDFEEINHINLFGKKYHWKTKQSGIVGDFNTSGINDVIDEIEEDLAESKNSKQLLQIFRECYSEKNLSEASRLLVNKLFGKYGIVILDANDKKLKEKLIPIIKEDVVNQNLHLLISERTEEFSKEFKSQAFVRDINFFQISEGKRERITKKISEDEIENNPEIFSPNVLIRPLYQELILPNIAYIGGGAEISYWMQLKTVFKYLSIPFPVLVLRNSVILEKSNVTLDLEKNKTEKMYLDLENKTSDISLKKSIKSESIKQIKSLEKIEKKAIKLEKEKHEISINQINKIKNKLFPNNVLQERTEINLLKH